MARPVTFRTDLILDTAVGMVAASGPAALSMAALAKKVGAPSGSLYHRFPGRAALLAEVWLRTLERFQDDCFTTLEPAVAPEEQARAFARRVITWAREHPDEAAVLLYAPDDFARTHWSAEQEGRARRGDRRVRALLDTVTAAVGRPEDRQAADRVLLALTDVPLAVIRRYARAGVPLPPYAERMAEDAAAALLAGAATS
jgi:AcrR family transcriptional regulator